MVRVKRGNVARKRRKKILTAFEICISVACSTELLYNILKNWPGCMWRHLLLKFEKHEKGVIR